MLPFFERLLALSIVQPARCFRLLAPTSQCDPQTSTVRMRFDLPAVAPSRFSSSPPNVLAPISWSRSTFRSGMLHAGKELDVGCPERRSNLVGSVEVGRGSMATVVAPISESKFWNGYAVRRSAEALKLCYSRYCKRPTFPHVYMLAFNQRNVTLLIQAHRLESKRSRFWDWCERNRIFRRLYHLRDRLRDHQGREADHTVRDRATERRDAARSLEERAEHIPRLRDARLPEPIPTRKRAERSCR